MVHSTYDGFYVLGLRYPFFSCGPLYYTKVVWGGGNSNICGAFATGRKNCEFAKTARGFLLFLRVVVEKNTFPSTYGS